MADGTRYRDSVNRYPQPVQPITNRYPAHAGGNAVMQGGQGDVAI